MQKSQKYKFKADRKTYEAEAQVLEVPRAGVLPIPNRQKCAHRRVFLCT